MDGERDVLERVHALVIAGVKTFDLQHNLAARNIDLAHLEQHLAADHFLGQLLLGGVLRFRASHDFAVAQHRHPIADVKHDRQFVGNEGHQGQVAAGHGTDGFEERLGFNRGQGRSGLVQDQHICPPVERLQDLDDLLLTFAELPNLGPQVNSQAVLIAQGRDFLLGPVQVQHSLCLRMAQDDVFQNGVGVNQLAVLVHHADAELDCIQRRFELDFFAAHVDLALIRLKHAEQDFHQRSLAGAVLTQDGVDFTRLDADINLIVGDDPWETLSHPAQFNDGRFHCAFATLCSPLVPPCTCFHLHLAFCWHLLDVCRQPPVRKGLLIMGCVGPYAADQEALLGTRSYQPHMMLWARPLTRGSSPQPGRS